MKYEAPYLIPRRAYARRGQNLTSSREKSAHQLTGCRQHMVTCKHSIRSSHETHCLFVLAQPLPTRRKPDDRRRKDDSCGGDRTEKHMMRNGLRSVGPNLAEGTEETLTSLFSMGVPLMGTRAFTGNDSGCSGILYAPGKRIY